MVDVQRASATARAPPTMAHPTATPSPSTSSAASSVHGDDAYGASLASDASTYRSSFKDDDGHDLTEGEESLYGGSISSPYFYGSQLGTPTPQQQRDDEEFFASYTGTPQQDLDDQLRANSWDYYYPPMATAGSGLPPQSVASSAASSPAPSGALHQLSRPSQQLPSRFPQDPHAKPPAPPSTLPAMRFTGKTSAFPTSSLATTMTTTSSSSTSSSNATIVASSRQGVKRPLERVSASSPMASPTVSIASSMIAMRNNPDTLDLAQTSKALLAHASATKPASSAFASNTINISTNSINLSVPSAVAAPSARKVKREVANDDDEPDAALGPAAKKTKVSRERQLKINAASRRCRKKQKVRLRLAMCDDVVVVCAQHLTCCLDALATRQLELQFLRTHVVDLQNALKEQVNQLSLMPGQQLRAARLSQFLDESLRKVDEMSSGIRPATPAANSSSAGKPVSESEVFKAQPPPAHDDRSGDDTDGLSASSDHRINKIEVDDVRGVHAIDPMVRLECVCVIAALASRRFAHCVRLLFVQTGYHLSDERKTMLLNIASFVRVNMSLESRSFSPEVISCLPIEMDGWQLRLSITEKNYTIHNSKFFPCDLMDMYDFCWETNVSQKISIKQGKKHYSVVTPLDRDVAHVYSKTIGKWSLSVHGVPNVSYNSLVCRRYEADQHRAIICQQSVLEERDFEDESTLPWLFKRWVVFQPHVVDGVHGTLVEAYRTASYATGKLIYKENNTYDSFCEHLIRRYAESNSLLERMMARDQRFQHIVTAASVASVSELDLDYEETASDRMVKDLLLF